MYSGPFLLWGSSSAHAGKATACNDVLLHALLQMLSYHATFSDVVVCKCDVSEFQSDALKRWSLLRSVVEAGTDELMYEDN